MDKEIFLAYLYSASISSVSYAFINRRFREPARAWGYLVASMALRVPIFLAPIPLVCLHTVKTTAIIVVGTVFTFTGITWAFISTSLSTLIITVNERGEKDTLLGELNAAIGAGTIIGSILSGLIFKYEGYTGVFAWSSLLVAISALLYYKAWKTLIT
ncbi:MAG: hypothetical protein F7B59_05595 [Desulfurococcales archaeon]|nr:hypothetical protein [Desulfurococcales archaeon]